jgi:hypothetical protein
MIPVATTATLAGISSSGPLNFRFHPSLVASFIPLDLASDLPYIAARIAVPDDGNCQLR